MPAGGYLHVCMMRLLMEVSYYTVLEDGASAPTVTGEIKA